MDQKVLLGTAAIVVVVAFVCLVFMFFGTPQYEGVTYDSAGCPNAGQTMEFGVTITTLGLVEQNGKQVCGISATGSAFGICGGQIILYIDFSKTNVQEVVICKTKISSDRCNYLCSNVIDSFKQYLQPGAVCQEAGQSIFLGFNTTTLGLVEHNGKQVCGISMTDPMLECGQTVIYVDLSATNPQEGVTCSTQVSSDYCNTFCRSIIGGAEYWSSFKSK